MQLTSFPPQALGHEDILRRIPHQGSMCLLDSVSAWDQQQIFCESASHLSASNPLRAHGRLGAACGIEYAAQAMAIHGALVAQSPLPAGGEPAGSPRGGYLVSVRGVTLHVEWLDDLKTALAIHASRVMGDENTIVYEFTIHAGPLPVLSGRAVVMLAAPAATTCTTWSSP